jgi:hypothetical protein
VTPPPWYADWLFWAFAVSALALVLSQLPPIHQMLRRGKLRVDLPYQINVAHQIGYPNVGLRLSVANVGEQAFTLESMSLVLSRDGTKVAELPAQAYYEKPADSAAYAFSPLILEGRQRWQGNVRFYPLLPRQEDIELRRAISAMKQDILAKRTNLPQGHADVPADPVLVAAITHIFDQKFMWMPGTYRASLSLRTDPLSAGTSVSFSFVLFESETAQLRAHADDYKFGVGPILVKREHWDLFVNIER